MATPKRKYKTSKLRTFLFFLLLALVFWTLTKFSKESTATIETYLAYVNLPSMVSVSKDSPKEISFDVKANGFELLSHKLKEPTIEIDVSGFYNEGDTLVSIPNTDLKKLIGQQLGTSAEAVNLFIQDLGVGLDRIVTKKVPVELITQLNFKDGYKMVGTPVIEPDSVTISGPSQASLDLDKVKTEPLVKKNLSTNLETGVNLEPLANSELSLSTDVVNISMVIEEFTQKTVVVPIETTKVPKELTLKLIPETIAISFDVSVGRFNEITSADFRVVCDYSERLVTENMLVPRLVERPEGLHRVELGVKKVDYLIFK